MRTYKALAAKLAIGRTNVSRLCARMEEAGDLERAAHPDDGRAWALRLTAKRRRAAQSVDDQSARHFGRLVKRLGDDVGRVVAALDQLSDAMTSSEEDA